METSGKSNKGIYVISFGKSENILEPLKESNHDGILVPEDMPRIDLQIKSGDRITVETKNGKVATVTRNGKKISKSLVSGKTKKIIEKEKQQQKDNGR